MNPLRVVAENYRSYEKLQLDLPAGCFAVTGRNGAGKSSILQLVDVGLFGGRDLSRQMNRTRGERMLVELELEHRDAVYRIRRTYNPAGRGKTTLDFEQRIGDTTLASDSFEEPVGRITSWEPLTQGNARDTQDLIDKTFQLSRETFRASAYLAQGDSAAFTEADPIERKRILADVLGLDVWDALGELAKRDRASAQEQLAMHRAGLDLKQELAAALDVQVKQREIARAATVMLTERVAPLRDRLAAATGEVVGAQAVEDKRVMAVSSWTSAKAAHNSAVRELESVQAAEKQAKASLVLIEEARPLAARLEVLEGEAAVLAAELTAWGQVEEKRRDHLARRRQAQTRAKGDQALMDRLVAELEQHEQQLAAVDTEGAVCDSCGQPLTTPEAREARRGQLEAKIAEAQRAIPMWEAGVRAAQEEDAKLAVLLAELPTEAPDQSSDLQAAMQRARVANSIVLGEVAVSVALGAAQKRLPEVVEQVEAAQRQLSAAQEAVEQLADAPPLADLQLAQDAAQDAWQRADSERERAVADYERTSGRCDELLERLTATGDPAAAIERMAVEVALADQLVEAYGRNGVPALIIETSALPQLEGEANRILADLGTSMLVELRTQRALKSGSGIRETLDIVVKLDGSEALYEDFSGGERTRLNLSLRIALARLLAHRRGAEVRCLIVDEPEFLDDSGTAQLAEVLNGLAGEFDRVALVSHVSGLRDAFDTVIEVERGDGEPSRIVT